MGMREKDGFVSRGDSAQPAEYPDAQPLGLRPARPTSAATQMTRINRMFRRSAPLRCLFIGAR